jgi:hypothetical protein
MRYIVDGIEEFPQPEEAAPARRRLRRLLRTRRLSRRPHGADPARGNFFTRSFAGVTGKRAAAEFFHTVESRSPHPSIVRLGLAGLVVTLALIGAGTRPARAQDATQPGGVQILFTPNLWLAGVNAAIKTPLPRVPEVNSSVGAFQLLGHLDAVPFLGGVEIHDGPFSLLGGAVHLPVSTSITTRNVFFDGGTAGLIANAGTATALYRALEQPTQYADLGVGFRAWAFTANLTLNPGILPGASATRSASWVDPLIAGRYHIDLPSGFLPSGFALTAYGDVGGFSLGAHSDWQLSGTIDYTPSPWIDLHLGYRSVNFNYQASGGFDLGFNVHIKGPMLNATFKF